MLTFHSRTVFLPSLCVPQKIVIYGINGSLVINFQTITKAPEQIIIPEDFLRWRPCALRAGLHCGFAITLSQKAVVSKVVCILSQSALVFNSSCFVNANFVQKPFCGFLLNSAI